MKLEPTRNHSIHLRLNDEQFEFLKTLANTIDVGVSDVVRMLVNSTLYASKKLNNEDTTKAVDKILSDTLGEPSANNSDAIERIL